MNKKTIEEKWVETQNEHRDELCEPTWSWDIGFRLDFDGPLLRVSSRFFQCENDLFAGSVSFCIMEDEVFRCEFTMRDIADSLPNDVEAYVGHVTQNIRQLLGREENQWVFTKQLT